MQKIEKHPSGVDIHFDPKWHKYTCRAHPRKKFVSGTKFLGNFFAPFDKENISKRYAAKNGMTQKAVLDMWGRKGEVSREAGTLIHDYLEARLLGNEVSHKKACFYPDFDITASAMSKIAHADLALEELLDKYEFIQAEMIVASLTHDIAGMIDILCRNKSNGNITFADWKTNAKIDFNNPWQSGLGPLQHLDECSYNKYSLQMALYQRIACEEGYLTGDDADPEKIDRVIIHIREDGHKLIPCADMQDEISEMINCDKLEKAA